MYTSLLFLTKVDPLRLRALMQLWNVIRGQSRIPWLDPSISTLQFSREGKVCSKSPVFSNMIQNFNFAKVERIFLIVVN